MFDDAVYDAGGFRFAVYPRSVVEDCLAWLLIAASRSVRAVGADDARGLATSEEVTSAGRALGGHTPATEAGGDMGSGEETAAGEARETASGVLPPSASPTGLPPTSLPDARPEGGSVPAGRPEGGSVPAGRPEGDSLPTWHPEQGSPLAEYSDVEIRATDPEPSALIAALLERAGLELASVLEPVSVTGQPADDLVEIAAAWSRVASWASARRGEALAELAGRPHAIADGWASGFVAVATEVAMREGVSRQAASTAVRTAVMLNGPLLATGDALLAGTIDPTKASLIARTLADLPFEVASAVEDEILPEAGSRTPSQLGRVLNQAVITVDPTVAEDRSRAAMSRRRVCHPKALPDGMASMYAVLPAGDAIALDLALDGAARAAKATGDARTVDQLRADVLAAVGADALRSGVIGDCTVPTACSPRTGAGSTDPDRAGVSSREVLPDQVLPDGVLPDGVLLDGIPLDQVLPDDLARLQLELASIDAPEPPDWLCHAPEVPRWSTGAAQPDVRPETMPPEWGEDVDGTVEPPEDVRLGVEDARSGAPPGHRTITQGADDSGPPDDDAQPGHREVSPPRLPDDAGPGPGPGPGPGSASPSAPYVLARKSGVPVRVNVTVPLSTLLGGDEPADLDGYGAIDAVTARALAMGGTWRRLVTDPLTGTVLDVGRSRYRPPADLAALVRLRDGTCFRPGCSVSATGCELDHTTPWSHLGTTSWANLGPGCSVDHGLKTNGDFIVRQHEPGVFTWTSKLTGMSYRRERDGRSTPLGRTRPPRPRHPRRASDDPMDE